MKTTVSLFDFQDAFLKSETYKNNFTIDGLNALFDWFEEYERDVNDGEEIDFDMVAICCEYSEYESALECAKEYGFELPNGNHNADDDNEALALSWLEDRTQVMPFEKGVIIANF
jgi:hypothetical protein